MGAADLHFALGLAAAEGWNPGLHDAAAFHAADPAGFLMGRIDGQPVGCISAVSYEGRFGFIGLYIVAPAFRGRGHGIALWRAGMQRLAGHNVGLDGVPAQQDNYRRSGFRFAYNNIRFEHRGAGTIADDRHIVAAASVPFATLEAYDRARFPAARQGFLRHWLAQPRGTALALVEGDALRGYGVIRRCHAGYKIGPLFADAKEVAERLFGALCRDVGEEPVYLDVPEVNAGGMRLAQRESMKRVFDTARMYTGEFPNLPIERVFGVTTFELG